VNTNDGKSREFPIVEEYTFRVTVSRAPPTAEIELSLFIDPHLSIPTEFKVVAPVGFNFTGPCLVAGQPFVTECNPGQPFADGRSTAVLTCQESGIRNPIPDLRIKVTTPKTTPLAKNWFVEGIDVLKEAQLGWGEATGFDVRNMSDISVTYPGIPGELGMIVWRFRTEVMVEAGGYLEISIPPSLNGECFPGRFEVITLPSAGGCINPAPGEFKVFLNSTIVPSEYAFAFYVVPPLDTPARNVLSITLKDKDDQVKDAAIDLPGYEIREKLKIKAKPLYWDLSEPGRPTMVEIGFTVIEPLPDNIVAPEQQVWTILLTLPVGFIHLVENRNDFQILNEDMPLRQPQSLDYMQQDRLRVFLNPNQTAWMALRSGVYKFRFQALVPELLPAYNVWQVSLCRDGYGPCNRNTAPAVLVNFAIKGFEFNEKWEPEPAPAPPVGMVTNAAHQSMRNPGSLPCWLLLALLSLFGRPSPFI